MKNFCESLKKFSEIKILRKVVCVFKKILFKFLEIEMLLYKKFNGTQKKLLIIRIDGIGDFIIFSPMLKYYKKIFPNYSIRLLINESCKELAERFNSIDEIITFNRKKFARNFIYRRNLLLKIKKDNFNIVIYPTYSRKQAGDYLVKMSRAKQRIGFDKKYKNNIYYTKLIKPTPDILPEVERNKEFIESLGIKADNYIPLFVPSAKDKKKATKILLKNGLNKNDKFAVICPGAGWIGRIWSLEKYVEIINWLKKEKNIETVICGAKDEKNLVKQIKNMLRFPIFNIVGKTSLPVLAAVLKKSVLYIGSETSIVHLASAVGKPAVCIIGGGNFDRFFPYGDLNKNKIVFHKMSCFYCNWRCKYDSVRCIENITVEQVMAKINEII